jgi:KDEL-tailed cysteine endopeptidase
MAISKAVVLAIVACLCFCSSVLAARELSDDLSMVARHESWMAQYGRVYKDAAEKAKRLEVFKTNVRFIDSFNAGNRKFYLGVNQFADITNEEFKASKANKGYKPSLERVPTGFRYENVSLDALPATVDWRTKGAVTPIKDQGQCGKYIFENDLLQSRVSMFSLRMLYVTSMKITNCRLLLGIFRRCCNGRYR